MTAAESAAPLNLVFQALADPTRRLMLERLTRGPASVSELARPFAMSLPAVVQHLQLLEASGLVWPTQAGVQPDLPIRRGGTPLHRGCPRLTRAHAAPSRLMVDSLTGLTGAHSRSPSLLGRPD